MCRVEVFRFVLTVSSTLDDQQVSDLVHQVMVMAPITNCSGR